MGADGARYVATTCALLALIAGYVRPATGEEIVLHATPEGVRRLERLVPILPSQAAIPAGTYRVSDCSTGGTLQVHRGDVDLQWNDVELRVEGDKLHIDANVDLDGDADVDANRMACLLSASGCRVSLSADNVRVSTDLDIRAEDGALSFDPQNVSLDTASIRNFNLDVDGCFVGDVVEGLIDAFGDWAIAWMGDDFGDLASDALAAVLGGLPLTIPETLTYRDYTVTTQFLSSEITEGFGVRITGDARLVTASGVAPESEPIPAPTEPALAGIGNAAFQLAASDALASHALRQAWWDGAFSNLLHDAKPSFEISSDELVRRLGLVPGTTVDIGIEVDAQPLVEFGRAAANEVSITLPDLTVLFTLRGPGQPEGRIEVRTSAHILGGFRIAQGGALILEARELRVDRLSVDSGALSLDADPARLEQLIRDVVLPLLSRSLESIPLAPALAPIPGFYVWIRGLSASGGWLRASFDLFSADPNDVTPPDTEVEDKSLVRAGLVSLEVEGFDNSTPPPLLRYQAWLDGVPVRESPSFLEHIRFSVTDGSHTLEVAAYDLTDNVDPEPARLFLEVDGQVPGLTVLSHPSSLMPRAPITAAWSATDDREGVISRWQVYELNDHGGAGEVVAEGETGAQGQMEVGKLPKGKLYVLRITAEDRAGNVTSQEFGFGFEQGGCSTGGGASSGWLVGLVLLFAARRRRRRRYGQGAALAIALAVLAPAPASAQTGMGSYFSSSVDADGAAPFWNPAAMAFAAGTLVDVGLSLPYMRISYDNPETAGSSTTSVVAPQPFAGAITDLGSKRFRLGMSVGVPYAVGARWDVNQPEGATTRYYANDAYLIHGLMTTSGAYQIGEHVSVGAGVHMSYAYLSAEYDKDFSSVLNGALGVDYESGPFDAGNPALAAPINLRSTGVGFGGLLGFAVALPRVRIGASLHSPVIARTRGTVEATYPDTLRQFVASAAPGAELPELSGQVAMDLSVPLAAFAAIAIDLHPAWELALDYRYADSGHYTSLDVVISESTSPDIGDTEVVKGTRDKHSAGARVIHSFLGGKARAAARARYENNTIFEVASTPNNVDFHKVELGGALRWQLSRRVHVTGMFTHYVVFEHQVDESLYGPNTLPSLDTYNKSRPLGTYSAGADILSAHLGLRY